MTDILRIVEKHTNHNGDPLSHPDLAQDITLIQNAMPTAMANEKEKATEFLKSLMGKIETKISEMSKELDGKADAMDMLKKATDACLAYMKPTGRKG